MRKRFLIIATAILAVLTIVLAFVINQDLIRNHMYPEDAIQASSNLLVRGIVISVEENHKSQGMTADSYHMFRFFFQLNVTEIVWLNWGKSNNTWQDFYVGYDNPDQPKFSVGQTVEGKGFFASYTDTPYSFLGITVSPRISGSYLKQI